MGKRGLEPLRLAAHDPKCLQTGKHAYQGFPNDANCTILVE